MTTRARPRIVVVGGGVAGLSTAFALKRRDPQAPIIVLERGAHLGGNIRTETVDGYTCEWGPDGFLDNAPATLRLVDSLGLRKALAPSNDAARRRFIFRGGELHEVPTSAGAFVKSRLISPTGKLRVLAEPFGRKAPQGDESIHDFATRRIGSEAATVMVGSMVSGIFAGDAHRLSLKACFPRMWQLEHEHGSLVRALIATRRTRGRQDPAGAPAGRLTSFVGGMRTLIDGLDAELGDVISRGVMVTSARRTAAGTWSIETSAGRTDAEILILAGPAAQSAAIIRAHDRALAEALDGMTTAPLAVVCLGFDAAGMPPLDGFGFLVPRTEGIRILGALWETSIYPDRAPSGKALLRVMIGGATDPAAVLMQDAELLATVRGDLTRTMNLDAVPEFVKIVRHYRGIPQFVLGHPDRLARIDELAAADDSLVLAGNSYRGVSINSCIADAERIANRLIPAH